MKVKTVNRVDFTEGKLVKKMFVFTLPLIFATLLQLLFNAADIAIVGRFGGTEYQSAVGATSSTIHLIINLLLGISIGANVLMASAFGAKDEERQSRIVHTSIMLGAVGGTVIMLIGLILSRPLMELLKTPDEIIEYSVRYMRIYFLGAPANILYNFAAAIYRGVGETKKPLLYLFVAGIVNVIINIVTVVLFHWNVVGVALGTVVSQYVAAVWVLIDLMKEKGALRYLIKKTKFYGEELKKILLLGVPTGISSCCFSLSNIVIQSTVNTYGKIVIAGNTIAMNIDGFIDTFTSSFGKTTLTVIGQNVGAKKLHRLRKAILSGLSLCVSAGLLCTAFMICFGEKVYGLYNSDPEVLAAAGTRMWFTSVYYFMVALLEIYGASLRGMGYSLTPMFVNLLCTCLFRVLWIWFVYPINPCIQMVYITYPVTWLLSGITLAFFYYFFERKFKRRFKD